VIIQLIVLAHDKNLTQQSNLRCNFASVMKKQFAAVVPLLFICLLLVSCAQKEKAIVLPPATGATPGSVIMGEAYQNQVFYDLENNTVAGMSEIASWDLSFEAAGDGSHVFMNGGKGVFLYNTHATEFGAVTALPSGFSASSLQFDDPNGRGDSTAVRDWRNASGKTKHEVFIAKLDDTTYYKFILLSVDSSKYAFQYGRMADATPAEFSLPKNDVYNFVYFSFTKGIVTPEPPKASWDFVFTRYRFIYRDLNNLPYEVNGVLLNPSKVVAAADSAGTFASLTYEKSTLLPFTTNRDAIGSDWKTYNFSTSKYEVNKNKCYVVHSRNDKVYKLHFLDFYSAAGVKGSPSFEAQQIQ